MFEGGHLLVLNQPAEFIIIGGAALGSLVMGTPLKILTQIMGQTMGLLKSAPGKKDYLDLLAALSKLFKLVQQGGMLALETHFENPAESSILAEHPKLLKNHHAISFLGDSVKVLMMGGLSSESSSAPSQNQTLRRKISRPYRCCRLQSRLKMHSS